MAKTGDNAVSITLRCCGVFILFATSGAISAAAFCSRFPDAISFFFPLPFAILFALMLIFMSVRTIDRVILSAALSVVVWYVAYFGSYVSGMSFTSASEPDSVTPCVLGGFIGGVGLVVCARVCIPALFSIKHFAGGAIVGACTALTFVPSITEYELHMNSGGVPPTPIGAFASWQAALATYVFAICVFALKRSESQTGEVDSFRVTPT